MAENFNDLIGYLRRRIKQLEAENETLKRKKPTPVPKGEQHMHCVGCSVCMPWNG